MSLLLLQGLGKDPEALRWYVQAELVHCRTAMAGVAGILIPAVRRSSSSSRISGSSSSGSGKQLEEQ